MSGGNFSHSEWVPHNLADEIGEMIAEPNDYPPNVIAKLRELEHTLNRSGEMLRLADYLAGGDIGIETFLLRWKEDVSDPWDGEEQQTTTIN